jgi:hypothetical protein
MRLRIVALLGKEGGGMDWKCDKINREQSRIDNSAWPDDEVKELSEHLVVVKGQPHRLDLL